MIGLTVVGKPAATVITSSPGFSAPLAELRRSERREGDEVGRRAAVHEDRVAAAEELAREAPLERVREAAGGEPEVERGVDEADDLLLVEYAPGDRDR